MSGLSLAQLKILWQDINRNHQTSGLNAMELMPLLPKGSTVPTWFKGAGLASEKCQNKTGQMLPFLASTEMAEMASHHHVSQHRWQRMRPYVNGIHHIHMPCCGAGLDAIHLLNHFSSLPLTISDIDPNAIACCRFNLSLTHPKAKIRFLRENAMLPALGSTQSCALYLDPARRSGQRLPRGTYLPDLASLMPIAQNYAMALIKLSPGEELTQLENLYPHWSWECVEYRGDLREISGLFHPEHSTAAPRSALLLHPDGSRAATYQSRPIPSGQAIAMEQCPLLFLLRPVLRQTELCEAYAKDHSLTPIRDCYGLWGGSKQPADPLSEAYRLLGKCPGKASALQKLLAIIQPQQRIELRRLGSSPPEWLHKQIRKYTAGKDSNSLVLLWCGNKKSSILLLEPYHYHA